MIKVWDQYQSKDSSFKVYEEPITDFPALTICPGLYSSNYSYDFDFTIYYDDTKLKLGENQIDNGDNSTETVYLEDVYTFVSGTCYRIYIKINYIIESGILLHIHIVFNDNITFENLPEVLEFYFTSEKNSHGIIFNEWKDGEEFAIKINKVKSKNLAQIKKH